MYRKEVNERSPLRLFDRTIHGGLGPGNLGVVLARAGVGKTAFLVQLGLDDLLQERNVLHVSVDSTIERVRTWYDELFTDLCQYTELADPAAARLLVERHRMIQVYSEDSFSVEKLAGVTGILRDHAGFVPAAILLDGLDWETIEPDVVAGLKAIAEEAGAELWATVLTHRHVTGENPDDLPRPCERFDDLIDVAVFMAPQGDRIDLRLLRDHDSRELMATTLELEPVSLRLSDTSVARIAVAPPRLDPAGCSLLSAGSTGAEVAFGETAERFGVDEVTFTFSGNEPDRTRGLTELDTEALERADRSLTFAGKRLSREVAGAPRRPLQVLCHQVHGANQVFVVGTLAPGGTVVGDASWAVELARMWAKPLWLFDQEAAKWLRWHARTGSWKSSPGPVISSPRFCGTGSRFLSDEGRGAITSLFERSFSRA
jgi:hypothetical protein